MYPSRGDYSGGWYGIALAILLVIAFGMMAHYDASHPILATPEAIKLAAQFSDVERGDVVEVKDDHSSLVILIDGKAMIGNELHVYAGQIFAEGAKIEDALKHHNNNSENFRSYLNFTVLSRMKSVRIVKKGDTPEFNALARKLISS